LTSLKAHVKNYVISLDTSIYEMYHSVHFEFVETAITEQNMLLTAEAHEQNSLMFAVAQKCSPRSMASRYKTFIGMPFDS
jgi:hypothetical protein